MTKKARLLFDVLGPRSLSRFDAHCRHPMQEQEKLLLALLADNADTEFGRRYGFDGIQSFSGFQKAVPITEYEDLEPYIEAARNGEPGQLTRKDPVFYAKTSGTTGASKYIPVTKSSRDAKARLMRVWLSGLFRDHPAILHGKILQITSPEIEEHASDGTPCGSEAGHAYRNMPRVMNGLYPVPYSACEIEDFEPRYYVTLRLAVPHPVTAIGTPNPSTILMLTRQLARDTESLIRDVRDGTIQADVTLTPEIREELEKGLEPDPERAAFLEKAASAGGGQLIPRHVWPEMEALACWKGGSVGSYLEELAPSFSDGLPVRDLGWLSSECRGSVPFADEGDSGALAVHINVYEFYPAEADDEPEPTDLLTVDQLEEGGRYFVYVTTSGGLYRYAMHDILEVTGFHERTPTVRFVQKGKGIVNFTGEKLTESQVLAAVEESLTPTRARGSFIAAVGRPPEEGQDPFYLFLMEYETAPSEDEAARLAKDLDDSLARHNIEYASKRKSGRLAPSVLRVLEPGQYDSFHRKSLQDGARDGQFKILRLTDDVSFADRFEGIVGDYRAA